MIIDEDIYLEHFGVKGMRWGVSNERSTDNSDKPPLTAKEKAKEKKERSEKRKKTVGKVAYGVFVAVYLASFLSEFGDTRTSTIPPRGSSRPPRPPRAPRAKSVSDIINARRDTEVSSLRRMHREGHMDDDQLVNFKRILNARYDRRIADALRDA